MIEAVNYTPILTVLGEGCFIYGQFRIFIEPIAEWQYRQHYNEVVYR